MSCLDASTPFLFSLGVNNFTLNLVRLQRWLFLTGMLVVLGGCGTSPRDGAEAQSQPGGQGGAQGPTAVDVAIAQTAAIRSPREYTGTTQPLREVSLRSQLEGQLLKLNVDVGDRVDQEQILAQVDDVLLRAAVTNAEAELAARQAEVSRLRTQVSEAKTRVEQARLQLQQADADANRLERLALAGAVTQQQAEQARTNAKTAVQILRSATEQVRNQEESIVAAERRVTAQRALLAQAQERRSYAVLTSPITGLVMARSTEVGNLLQPGTEIVKLGDFSKAKVTVQVSELELANVRLGGRAIVRLDAIPKQQFSGTVTRVSPAADPTSRLVPIEVTIPNPARKVGSGLLARVSFERPEVARIVVPLTALQEDRGAKRPRSESTKVANASKQAKPRKTEGVLFVVANQGEQPAVSARKVRLGEQTDGRVEILSGLKPGERYVIRTGKPLKEGETVRLSILSEK